MSTKNPVRDDRVTKSDAEWQRELSPLAFKVTRKHGTEPPGTSPLNDEKRDGLFKCVCCGEPVFDAATKFESGTGWPSFHSPASEQAIGTSTDYYLLYPRTEVHCGRCDAHLGHVFKDGPKPTGLRYCINGVALTFEPKT
jgi:peptide-methionine (R)-S-oxide reductase